MVARPITHARKEARGIAPVCEQDGALWALGQGRFSEPALTDDVPHWRWACTGEMTMMSTRRLPVSGFFGTMVR